jgi:VWFA-related protein
MKWALLFFAAAAACAQEPQFQTHAREVLVPVSVLTKTGKPVESLAASDFLVLSDGQPQTVRMVERDSGVLPIHAVIVLQTSDFGEPALAKIRKTASVISSYITNDMEMGTPSLAAVVSVSDEVRVEQDFTADAARLEDAFEKIKARGDAGRLLDGVSEACDLLAARKERARRVIVLISESRDRKSQAQFLDVVRKAQKAEAVVYTISYSAYKTAFTEKTPDPGPDQPGLYDPSDHGGASFLGIALELARLAKVNVAEGLAQATGGSHEKFTTLHGLEERLAAIGNEVHNRYTLTFVPPEPQPEGFHRLSVTVGKTGEFRVHARAGYWSAAE